jgi:hypothetical protein
MDLISSTNIIGIIYPRITRRAGKLCKWVKNDIYCLLVGKQKERDQDEDGWLTLNHVL